MKYIHFIFISILLLIGSTIQLEYIGGLIIDQRQWISWTYVAVIIGTGFLISIQRQEIIIPKFAIIIGIYLLLVLIAAIFAPRFNPEGLWEWYGFLAGILLFLALHQQPWDDDWKNNLFLVFIITGVAHAIIGIFQFYELKLFGYSFYHHKMAVGGFYQKNVLASFLATTLMMVFALQIKTRHVVLEIGLMLSIVLISYTLALTKSLVGFGGLVVGGSFLMAGQLYSHWKYKTKNIHYEKPIINHWVWLILVIIGYVLLPMLLDILFKGVSIGGSLISEGSIVNKIEAGSNMATILRTTYMILCFNIFLDNPLFGTGIGTFAGVARPYFADALNMRELPSNYFLNSVLTHPHNEFFYRLAESGIFGFIGLILIAFGVIHILWRLGIQRGLMYAGVLLPAAIHTQTELPYYQNAVSWGALVMLIYLPSRSYVKVIKININRNIKILVTIVITFLMLVTAVFTIDKAIQYPEIFKVYSGFYNSRKVSREDQQKIILRRQSQDSYYSPILRRQFLADYMVGWVNTRNKAKIIEHKDEFFDTHKFVYLPPAEFLKSSIYYVLNDHDKALEQYKKARYFYPTFPGFIKIGNILWFNKINKALKTNDQTAIKEFVEWVEKQKNLESSLDANGYIVLIRSYIKTNKQKQAIATLKKAIKKYPKNPTLLSWVKQLTAQGVKMDK